MTSTRSPLRQVARGVYAPALVFEIGIGAIAPIIPLSAVDLGGNLAVAAVLVALLGVGQIAGDVPAGALAARIGDRRAMLVAAGLSMIALAGCALAPSLWVLGIGVFAVGATNAVFVLARQAYLTEVIPVMMRARALSTLGGVQRIGAFIGPFLGAAIVHLSDLRGVYWLAVGTSLLAGVVVLVVPDAAGAETIRRRQGAHIAMGTVLRQNGKVFATLGFAVLAVGAVRASRQVVLPLWSAQLGFSPATTSIIFGISGAVDMLLFYPAGRVMDRRGRLWVAIPSMLILGGSILLLPITSTLAGVTAAAMVMGLGNGIGSGILMTLGADVAPRAVRPQFLGIWRLFSDSGNAAGPLVVAAGAALGSLAAGIATMGAFGLLAAAGLARWVPRFSDHANAATRRRAAAREIRAALDSPPDP
ncbi:MFS transporter [Pengzhenrongella sicca]|uniref:MFS transporter n=1 Tax=Pengzhenrongella sicca TaxID=2819238 RepID=A0A8A4ZD53_9MICO|nr:MFS transporter [Pengzhenrongella sicca]QTE29844.1 MFS transporter [Pengzhenrongella sicca]